MVGFWKKFHFDKISTHHNFVVFKIFEFLALILISNSDFDQEINIYFQPKKCWFSGSIQHPYFHFRLFRDFFLENFTEVWKLGKLKFIRDFVTRALQRTWGDLSGVKKMMNQIQFPDWCTLKVVTEGETRG